MDEIDDFSNDGFPHFDQRYISKRFCCGSIHCTDAGKRIAIIWLVIFSILLIKSLVEFDSSPFHFAVMGSILFLFLIVFSFFAGIKKRQKYFILPFLVFHLVLMATYLIVIVLISALMFSPANRSIDLMASNFPPGQAPTPIQHTLKFQAKWTGSVVAVGLLEALTYWWFYIIRRCYRYIRDVNAFRDLQEVSIPLQTKDR